VKLNIVHEQAFRKKLWLQVKSMVGIFSFYSLYSHRNSLPSFHLVTSTHNAPPYYFDSSHFLISYYFSTQY